MASILRSITVVALLLVSFTTIEATAQEKSNVQEAIDAIVLLCVGGGSESTTTTGGGGEIALSLKKLGLEIGGEVTVTEREAKGLVDGLTNEMNEITGEQASEVRECMRPFVHRIVDALIGYESGQSSYPGLPQGFSIDQEGFVTTRSNQRICREEQARRLNASTGEVQLETVTTCKLFDGTWNEVEKTEILAKEPVDAETTNESENVASSKEPEKVSAKYPWYGFLIYDIWPELVEELKLSDSLGVAVYDVSIRGPGEKVGIREKDIIKKIDGKSVQNYQDFQSNVVGKVIGDNLVFEVLREGRLFEIDFEIGHRTAPSEFSEGVFENEFFRLEHKKTWSTRVDALINDFDLYPRKFDNMKMLLSYHWVKAHDENGIVYDFDVDAKYPRPPTHFDRCLYESNNCSEKDFPSRGFKKDKKQRLSFKMPRRSHYERPKSVFYEFNFLVLSKGKTIPVPVLIKGSVER